MTVPKTSLEKSYGHVRLEQMIFNDVHNVSIFGSVQNKRNNSFSMLPSKKKKKLKHRNVFFRLESQFAFRSHDHLYFKYFK